MATPGDGGFTVNPTELNNAQGQLENAQAHWNTIADVISNQAPIPAEAFGVGGALISGVWEKYYNATIYLQTMATNAASTLALAGIALGTVGNNYTQTDASIANNLANTSANPNS